jgi:UDP-N-acetylmuramate: L-alanyl-gamma-D-glutamyl-meso-diaminopimelate ligase
MDPVELAGDLTSGGTPADFLPEVERIVERVVAEAKPGDTLLVMSNGGFGGIHARLLAELGG